MTNLLEALGNPSGGNRIPGRRSQGWVGANKTLHNLIRAGSPNIRKLNFRTWQTLWACVWDSAPPSRATWNQLAQGLTLQHVIDKLATTSQGTRPSFTYWNARWLVDPQAEANTAKRGVIMHSVNQHRIVALTETHWGEVDFARWKHHFPTATVYSCCARITTQGGRLGGTAVLIPPRYTCLQSRTLIAGCAQALDIKRNDSSYTFTLIVVYLPNHEQEEIMRQLDEHRSFPLPTFVVGDLNCDLTSPRTETEERCLGRFHNWIGSIGAIVTPTDGPTRRERGNQSTIDAVAVPRSEAWRWRPRCSFHGALSDHAAIQLHATNNAIPACSNRCPPHIFKTLSQDAILDLRRRFASLETHYQIPHADYTPNAASYNAPQRPGECSPHDPACASDAAHREQSAPTETGRNDQGTPIPWMPCLARHGYACLQAQISSWWRHWSRTKHSDSLADELRNAGDSPATSVVLSKGARTWAATWLQGEIPERITPQDAGMWLRTLHNLNGDRTRHKAGQYKKTSAARRPIAREYTAGRSLLKAKLTSPGLRGRDGHLTTDPACIDAILWDSRRHIWTSDPDETDAGRELFRAYFADGTRTANLPQQPEPLTRALASTILNAKNSAPGLDGKPYEIYHHGVPFTVHLLGQAFLAMDTDNGDCTDILGPNHDLGIWIPKKEGNELPSGQRPLQLPSTLRRLFGSALMDIVAPSIEPLLSRHQAATKGGSCGQNIKQAYEHLTTRPTTPSGAVGPLWNAILGDLSEPCAALCRQRDNSKNRRHPAAVLADQSKAFERLSLNWLIQILRAWKFPKWATHAFIALVFGRSVGAVVNGKAGPLRLLRRGVGMGGPPSMFLWNLCYDPIIEGLANAVLAETPTYVDDLCGLVTGPAHGLRLIIFLIVAGHAAGLATEVHHCSQLSARTGRREAGRLLASFPVRLINNHPDDDPRDDSFTAHGLPGDFLCALLTIALGPAWSSSACVTHSECNCSIKTVIVPAASVSSWSHAHHLSPYGSTAVKPRGPYLGVSLGTASTYEQAPGEDWTATAWESIQFDTWANPIAKLKADHANCTGTASAGLGASLWRTYMSPKLVYPAALCKPHITHENDIRAIAVSLFPTNNWACWEAPFAMGPVHGVPGSPRHPSVIIAVASTCAWIRHGTIGPKTAPAQGRDTWKRCLRWARAPGAGHGLPLPRDAQRQAILNLHNNIESADKHRLLRAAGPGIRQACWEMTDMGRYQRWQTKRSANRRWWITGGEEWAVLGACATFTSAYHVLRLLAGGLHSGTGVRDKTDRQSHPRQ